MLKMPAFVTRFRKMTRPRERDCAIYLRGKVPQENLSRDHRFTTSLSRHDGDNCHMAPKLGVRGV